MSVTGKQIRAARAALGIKLKELAVAARISPTTLSKIENGSNAYDDTLRRLRGELERQGVQFKVEAGTSWVGFPDTHESPKNLAKTIGRVTHAARRALGLTQEAAAERIGVSVDFYARLERGESMPSLDTLVRMGSVFRISFDELLLGTADSGKGEPE